MFELYQATNMASAKSTNKVPTTKKKVAATKRSIAKSQKLVNIKSTVSSRATTASSSQASTAACSQPSTSSQGPSRCATVEESDDDNDNKPGHVGDSLDPDGDTIMELSSDEEVEDDESELSKAANI
jgi:hypothetical protein